MLCPVSWIGGLLIGNPGSSNVRDIGYSWRMQYQVASKLCQTIFDRRQHLGMERMSSFDTAMSDLVTFQAQLYLPNGFYRPGQYTGRRCIDYRQIYLLIEIRPDICLR